MKNLDVFLFDYILNGPQLIINEDKPIIISKGTESEDIFIESE